MTLATLLADPAKVLMVCFILDIGIAIPTANVIGRAYPFLHAHPIAADGVSIGLGGLLVAAVFALRAVVLMRARRLSVIKAS